VGGGLSLSFSGVLTKSPAGSTIAFKKIPNREGQMADRELIESVAYCGLICGLCRATEKGCEECKNGGGPDDCFQRECCTEKGFEGCWQCDTFPCEEGFFADKEWKGLCQGFIRCIRDKGMEEFVSLVLSNFKRTVEYGDFRFKNEEEIAGILHGTE